MSDFFNGFGKFKTAFDAAALSIKDRISDIDPSEFDELKTLFQQTKGRFSLTDGQTEAHSYVKARDPALAATLKAGGTYDDYRTALHERMDKGQALPTDWRLAPRAPTAVDAYRALPDDLKSKVLSLRETVDLHLGATVTNKAGMMKTLERLPEWKELESQLKAHHLSVVDALAESGRPP